ncbi:MAG: NADH-quinone oxidoreductase subunit L [Alphaproteobacteria bacterium MarineAlpha5_Bin8]|nr:MAG: NADH-quinone oxidoreductase subunit L [Alphaproteobacteria bacterium MarineAlpha5_Bin7]PPR46635.1 MAG: NADH-quinone oxidoreductase subunit L [Alphaproteobacteria bacterium MarineAlpha5_Bin8]PPR53689.1 MAG: NADH-quinone oxidoreductase subunit L [Alphaproteobacteria bacterium MarineAlpha5_Bin6]
MIISIVFLPLIGFLYCIFFGKIFGDKSSQIISTLLLFISTMLSWYIFIQYIEIKNTEIYFLFNWITSGSFIVNWAFRVDALTSAMLIVVTTVSFCVHLYSIGYMKSDKSISRFMSYLSLFTFFMLMLVTSDNLLQMFFGWEGVGLTSYLLIGFWNYKESANKAAIKAFIVNRVGDFAFALGIAGIFFIFGSIEFDIIFEKASLFKDHTIYFLGFNFSTINLLCFLLFIGAMGKSAQLGLHTWLPDAMEGPTPVSALIHAATMVTAGVFMVARLSPLFTLADTVNIFITFIGASTAVFAATIALTQNDIKRVIAYSTCSQLGYMFFAAGLGAYNASIFHLTTHGFFKALLFLSAGSVIHAMHHEQDMRKMGGLFYKVPLTATMMWIGSLAIIGFPYLSGYYSKDIILETAFFSSSNIGSYAYFIGIFTALLTAFYSWRLLFLTFHGETRVSKENFVKIHESPLVMLIPLFLLSIGSIFSGVFLSEYFIGSKENEFWNSSVVIFNNHYHMPFSQILLSKVSVSLGILIAVLFYFFRKELAANLASNFNFLYSLSLNKWYVDELYNFLITKPFFALSNILWKNGDKKIIDEYGPNGISRIINAFSSYLSQFQSGYLYHYAFVMLAGLVIILSWFVYF